MNRDKQRLFILLAVITALTMTVCVVSAQNVQNTQAERASHPYERTIVGVWRTVVTARDCQTGNPIFSLPGLFTFNEGGTMAEYGIGPGSTPALRSPGHGLWHRDRDWQEFSFAFTYYRYDSTGMFIGSQKVMAALELAAGGNSFTTSSAIQVFDANYNLIGTACANAGGTRFE